MSDCYDKYGFNPFHYVAWYGRFEVSAVELMLETVCKCSHLPKYGHARLGEGGGSTLPASKNV